jgi:hypothetical protein
MPPTPSLIARGVENLFDTTFVAADARRVMNTRPVICLVSQTQNSELGVKVPPSENWTFLPLQGGRLCPFAPLDRLAARQTRSGHDRLCPEGGRRRRSAYFGARGHRPTMPYWTRRRAEITAFSVIDILYRIAWKRTGRDRVWPATTGSALHPDLGLCCASLGRIFRARRACRSKKLS